MSKQLEINKMLTLSTCHIKQSTAEFLDKCCNPGDPTDLDNNDTTFAISYKKSNVGYIIYIITTDDIENSDIPSDLADCLKFAMNNDCDVLCLDRDGDTFEYPDNLPRYEW